MRVRLLVPERDTPGSRLLAVVVDLTVEGRQRPGPAVEVGAGHGLRVDDQQRVHGRHRPPVRAGRVHSAVRTAVGPRGAHGADRTLVPECVSSGQSCDSAHIWYTPHKW
ncbi:hypothetical protein GCM10010277_81600 [Streptomyces longisporoflavus]|nr:hypothetical protein GCM10010277_81600 [Streptomyces longisporoflavus]